MNSTRQPKHARYQGKLNAGIDFLPMNLRRCQTGNDSSIKVFPQSIGYNQANQRTGVTRTAGDYVNYTYDNMGELKTALGKEAGGVTNGGRNSLVMRMMQRGT
jgi:hypothetical protein